MKNRNRLLGTMFLALTALTGLSGYAQSETGNNGDIQEKEVRDILTDIADWIHSDGSTDLKGAPKDYDSRMLNVIEQKPIFKFCEKRMVNSDHCDPRAGSVNKPCENYWENGRPVIECIRPEVVATNLDQLYAYIHHEVAGLAGIEVNGEDPVSEYSLSGQVSNQLEAQVVIKLGKNSINLNNQSFKFDCMEFNLFYNLKFEINLNQQASQLIQKGEFTKEIGTFNVDFKSAMITRVPPKNEHPLAGKQTITAYDLDKILGIYETGIASDFNVVKLARTDGKTLKNNQSHFLRLSNWQITFGPSSKSTFDSYDLRTNAVLGVANQKQIVSKETVLGNFACRLVDSGPSKSSFQSLRRLLEASFKLRQ